MTSVCPALWPPWKRTTTSARALSQSTIFPLPSSPHWAPITATLAIWFRSLECRRLYLLHRLRDRLIHLQKRDRVGPGRGPAQIEVRDVHAGIAQKRTELADESRFVLI